MSTKKLSIIIAEDRQKMIDLKNATGVTPHMLLAGRTDVPEDLTENKIRHWLNGRSKSARPDHLRYVIRAWEELPRYEFVENPADEIAEMRRLKEETGFGFSALLSGQREEMPEGLRADIIKGWFENTRVKARRDHLDYVLARWRSLRDDGRVRLAILPDHIDELRGHIERTGVSIKQLLENADDVPGRLSLPMLRSWFTESPPHARQEHLDYVFARWRNLPDFVPPTPEELGIEEVVVEQGRIALTPELLRRIDELQESTGVGMKTLTKKATEMGVEIPDGWNANMHQRWRSQTITRASGEHLVFAIKVWESLPTVAPKRPITDAEREALSGYRDRGFLPGTVFKCFDDKPERLSSNMVSRWLSGKTNEVRPDHLEWVLSRCAELGEKRSIRIGLTQEMRDALKAERGRTGVDLSEFMALNPDAPDGVNAPTLSNWICGYAKTARKDHYEWVLERWRDLPDG